MSGIEERPNKQKEIFVGDLSAKLYDTIDNQERRSWKFGVFDKTAIVCGAALLLMTMLLGTMGILGLAFTPGTAIGAIMWLGEGCVSHERIR